MLRNLVKKFEDFGGDKRFLEFLRNYPQSPIPQPRTRRQLLELKRKGRQLVKLHAHLSRDPLFAADARLGELRSIADSISKLRSFRGAPITRSELYFWLAALVPYTLHVTGEPRWVWIKLRETEGRLERSGTILAEGVIVRPRFYGFSVHL